MVKHRGISTIKRSIARYDSDKGKERVSSLKETEFHGKEEKHSSQEDRLFKGLAGLSNKFV